MDDTRPDWADEIATKLTNDWTYSGSTDASNIAIALRKAKADGMREAAKKLYDYKRKFEIPWRTDLDEFLMAAADKIEQGKT